MHTKHIARSVFQEASMTMKLKRTDSSLAIPAVFEPGIVRQPHSGNQQLANPA